MFRLINKSYNQYFNASYLNCRYYSFGGKFCYFTFLTSQKTKLLSKGINSRNYKDCILRLFMLFYSYNVLT